MQCGSHLQTAGQNELPSAGHAVSQEPNGGLSAPVAVATVLAWGHVLLLKCSAKVLLFKSLMSYRSPQPFSITLSYQKIKLHVHCVEVRT